MADEASFDPSKNILTVGTRRVVFHCHHYNVFLQRTLDESLGEDASEIQRDAAAEAARVMLHELFATDGGAPFATRIERARALFGSLGFGAAEPLLTASGGQVTLKTSHYAIGWQAKFGKARNPTCHFAAGFWRGALTAAAALEPERVRVQETRCHAVAGGACELQIEVL